jgi:SAM-dependent methyltransferase
MGDLEKYRASEKEKSRTEDLLNILPKGRRTILDVGARDGRFSKLLTAYFEEVTALDLQKPAFDIPGVVAVAGDVTQLPFPADSFDCVFCTEVLEHVRDIEKACSELARVAKHELILGVPFRQDIRLGRTTCRTCGKVNPPWGHVNSFEEDTLPARFPDWQIVSQSFVGTSKEATNALSTFLMDLAGNPWGTYSQDETCIHCGASLKPPRNRTFWQRICCWLAIRINRFQALWIRPHGNWIHLVLTKPEKKLAG